MDTSRVEDEALDFFRSLLRLDTTNPPGNELAAAEMIDERFARQGIQSQVIKTGNADRGCVVARVRGDGTLPPLLLTAHLDVVEADASQWLHPPFAAEIHEGYIYGRGAIDMKNMAAMSVQVLSLVAELGIPLKRDIIFAGVADEESGCEQGSFFLVENHADLVRAEYMIGEVGGFSLHLMGKTFYPIQVAEKGIAWLKATARGEPGHGSMPREDSAVLRLARAITKLGDTRFPHHATPTMQLFLEGLAARLPFPASSIMPLLANTTLGYKVLDIAIRDPSQRRSFAALLGNTASPTVLRAGDKTNVIPGEATVQLDGRTLPGQTTSDFLAELRHIIGDDLDLQVIRELAPVETSHETELFGHLAKTIERHDPGSTAVPYMIPGFTDAKAFSRLGTRCYGFSPVRFDPSHGVVFSKLYHGNNERIPVEGFKWGLRVLWDAVVGFCAR